MFNKSESFYKAEVVVLVCAKSPKEYDCLVLPLQVAEEAAQVNLRRCYRRPKKNGGVHKPGKVWIALDYRATLNGDADLYDEEIDLLKPYRDNWDWLQEGVEQDGHHRLQMHTEPSVDRNGVVSDASEHDMRPSEKVEKIVEAF